MYGSEILRKPLPELLCSVVAKYMDLITQTYVHQTAIMIEYAVNFCILCLSNSNSECCNNDYIQKV